MITITEGLKQGLLVLEHLRNNKELQNISITVCAFSNCRECGLTFVVHNGSNNFTWCVYEHRNSDQIIVNGAPGFISMAGDLPYKGDTKGDYIQAFEYNQSLECANFLADEFKKFCGITIS